MAGSFLFSCFAAPRTTLKDTPGPRTINPDDSHGFFFGPRTDEWPRGIKSNVASPGAQGQIPQRGEEVLHLLLQEPVAVLRVLSRPLRVPQFDLQHALLLPLLLHLLFQALHLRAQGGAGLLQPEGTQHNTNRRQRSSTLTFTRQ